MNKFLAGFMILMFLGIAVNLYSIYLDSSVSQVQTQTIDLSNGEGRSCQKQ